MLEELVALAMIEDRRRKLDSIILVVPARLAATASTRGAPLSKRLAAWFQPRAWSAVVPHEVRLEAEAWRIK